MFVCLPSSHDVNYCYSRRESVLRGSHNMGDFDFTSWLFLIHVVTFLISRRESVFFTSSRPLTYYYSMGWYHSSCHYSGDYFGSFSLLYNVAYAFPHCSFYFEDFHHIFRRLKARFHVLPVHSLSREFKIQVSISQSPYSRCTFSTLLEMFTPLSQGSLFLFLPFL